LNKLFDLRYPLREQFEGATDQKTVLFFFWDQLFAWTPKEQADAEYLAK